MSYIDASWKSGTNDRVNKETNAFFEWKRKKEKKEAGECYHFLSLMENRWDEDCVKLNLFTDQMSSSNSKLEGWENILASNIHLQPAKIKELMFDIRYCIVNCNLKNASIRIFFSFCIWKISFGKIIKMRRRIKHTKKRREYYHWSRISRMLWLLTD